MAGGEGLKNEKAKGKNKGKNKGKYSEETKEIAKNVYASLKNFAKTAKEVGVSEATIRNWAKAWEVDPEFKKLCDDKKEDFAEKAQEIIDSGLQLLKKRFLRALEFEDEMDEALREIIDSGKMSKPTIKHITGEFMTLKLQRVSEITTAIGTLYDKRALSKGETTENTNITFDMPQEVEKIAD